MEIINIGSGKKISGRSPRQGKQTQLEVDEVLKQLGNRKNLEILDLCCGEGRHSVLFAKKGH